MLVIDNVFLDNLTEDARKNERLRMNYNLHESLDSKAQRLLNALEPGTFLPVHRHVHTAETYFIVRGRLNVYFYDENKRVIDMQELNPLKGVFAVQIPKCQWHTVEVLESGTVVFEVKDGPYTPITSDNLLN